MVVFDLDNDQYWLSKASALEQGDLSMTVGIGALYEATEEGEETEATLEDLTTTRASGVIGQAKKLVQAVDLAMTQVDRDQLVNTLDAGMEYVQFGIGGAAEPASIYLVNVEGRAIVIDIPRDASRSVVRKLSEDEVTSLGLDALQL